MVQIFPQFKQKELINLITLLKVLKKNIENSSKYVITSRLSSQDRLFKVRKLILKKKNHRVKRKLKRC